MMTSAERNHVDGSQYNPMPPSRSGSRPWGSPIVRSKVRTHNGIRQARQLDQQPTSHDRMTDLNADRARGERAAALEESSKVSNIAHYYILVTDHF